MIAKVISDFEPQIYLGHSASDSNKDWKRMGDWAPVWYRLGSKNIVFDYLRFYEIKSYLVTNNRNFCLIDTTRS